MKKILLNLLLIIISISLFSQEKKEILDLDKYKDCLIKMPIKSTMRKSEKDTKLARHLNNKEVIIYETKKNLTIKEKRRGVFFVNDNGVFFMPMESFLDKEKDYVVFLMFGKNDYVFDAKCFLNK